jgi:GalNAc-alpha-(1->4)-GalNAc-alpha-(1->3)-diNAcBac-PP-undecaprenol alpha-1,4-N-acetyl-D-galactosaminyltransferase
MRVVLVISSLAAGGAQRVILELATNLVSRGHHVTLVTYSDPRIDHFRVPPGVERLSLDLLWPSKNVVDSISSAFRRLSRMRSSLAPLSADAIVSFIDLTNVLVLAATRGLRVPVIVSERVHPRFHRIDFQWRIARRLLYPFADRLVVQTKDIAEWARRVVPRGRISVIPNSAPSMSETGEERREKLLLAVGRLNVQKGFDLLLRAFAESAVWRDGWRAIIVGEGPERANLQALADKLGIGGKVEFPGETDQVASWYRRAGMFVLSSRYEGFPNVLLEAMSHGCPSIAFDCPSGPRDIVQSGKNGRLLPAEDVDALIAAIRELSADALQRQILGEAAREVRTRFSPELITDRWEELLVRVAHRA